MRKHLCIATVFLLGVHLLAESRPTAETSHAKIEITANHVTSDKTTVEATGGVVVYYQDTLISAERAHFNKENHLLQLDGHIEMIGYNGSKEHTRHLEIHTDTKEVHFEELFLITRNDVWFFTKQADKREGNYTFGETLFSSCDIKDPLWKMVASHGVYDSKERYMKTYGTKMYFKDIPFFYMPYLAFSTDRRRKSGLLFPSVGYKENEGFLYEQPLYWAISAEMDLELNPQVRTQRGYGMYGTFRFADSPYSHGAARLGYFRDTSSFQQQEATEKKEHYGLEVQYDSTNVLRDFLPEGFSDALYLNAIYLNDIEYLNLQQSKFGEFGQTPIQESKLNYFLANDTYYMGLNAKYFIDTRLENNHETIQQLPVIQMHRYLSPLLWKNLTYSLDLKIKNFERVEGATMSQAEMTLPIEFTTTFFHDFMHLSLADTLYYSKSFFGNETSAYDDFQYFSDYRQVKLFSDLTRKYAEYIHVLQPALSFIHPGEKSQKPVDFEALSQEQKALFVIAPQEEYYAFSLNHYLYDRQMHLKFYQRISQRYYTQRAHKLSDIRNEMQYNWGRWQFYSDILYAMEFHRIHESSTRITLSEAAYDFSLTHTFKQQLSDESSTVSSDDINLHFGYQWSERLHLHGGLIYDIDMSESKQWLFGGSYKEDCWGMTVALRQDITPRPGGKATTENSIYVQFDFTPFITLGSGSFQ